MKQLILSVALAAVVVACAGPQQTNATGDASQPKTEAPGCCADKAKTECSTEAKQECAESKTCPVTGKTIN